MATKEREEFLARLASKVGKNWFQVLEAGRAAMRIATAEQRWCDLECSAHMDDKAIADGQRKSERRHERMTAIAASLGVAFEAQGDPRGAVYTLAGLAVPSQGYSAATLDRICAFWEHIQTMRDKAARAAAAKAATEYAENVFEPACIPQASEKPAAGEVRP